MTDSQTIRLIIDAPADGPTNMARDEAILSAVGKGESPGTLRFYRWEPPTISLGYFQSIAEFEALPPPARDLAVVRRQTGGGAILHDQELTYSLTLALTHPLLSDGNASGLYEHVHSVFERLLKQWGVPVTRGPKDAPSCSHGGPFFCFERHSCFDLIADGKKVMGSAQRRTPLAVLQHGSLVLDSRFDQQQCATVAAYTNQRIEDHLQGVAGKIAGDSGMELGTLTEQERQSEIEFTSKYAGGEWTRKR